MALNFPDSPTVGDSYTAAGRTWVWDGTTWNNDATAEFDSVQFNTDADVDPGVGEIAWNSSEGTLDLGLSTTKDLHVGEEVVYRVRNSTGSTIAAGTSLYSNGVTGSGRITVAPFVADGSIQEVSYVGLATESIPNGINGFVQHFGYVRNIDTRGTAETAISVGDEDWSAGDILYAHPTVAGKLTKVQPEHSIVVATITVRHQNDGVLLVRPSIGEHLNGLHDVQITSIADGDYLQWNNANSRWENTSGLATFVTDATTARTVTASDAGKTILFTSASAVTMTVDASTDFAVGERMDFIQDGAGVITVTASGATIAAAETSTTSGSFTIGAQYSAATLLCVGTDSYRLIGNIAAV